MPFQLSPGVNVTEIDLTTVVPTVATSDGAIAGVYRWGPVGERILIDSENLLAARFGKPTSFNAETFFTGANFLSYSNRLWVSRAANTSGSTPFLGATAVANSRVFVSSNSTALNTLSAGMYLYEITNTSVVSTGNNITITSVNSTAFVLSSVASLSNVGSVYHFARPGTAYTALAIQEGGIVANLTNQIVKNEVDYNLKDGNFDSDVLFAAKYPGSMGNSLRISTCLTTNDYSSNVSLGAVYSVIDIGDTFVRLVGFTDNAAAQSVASSFSIGDQILAGNSSVGYQYMQIMNITTTSDANSNPTEIDNSTISFDGFADVNTSADFIYVTHPYMNGDLVTYTNESGNNVITGLSNNASYYVVASNSSGLKLATTPFGTAISITATSISNSYFVANTTAIRIDVQDPYRLHTPFSSQYVTRHWEFYNSVDGAPGQSDFVRFNGNTAANDEMHIVVVDDGGAFTGTPGTILEVYKGLSRATDSKNNDNSGNYYKDVINQNSAYVWWANDDGGALSANAMNVSSSVTTAPGDYYFTLGNDGYDESNPSAFSSIASAYDMFRSSEDVDISLVMQGRPLGGLTSVNGTTVGNYQMANYIIDNICEIRKDCVALVSPDKSLTLNSFGTEATNLAAWRGALHSTSYAVMDTGYKYQYDRYNDVYRWIPMNGDIAGLCARTDQTNDAWWSPAGFNRGQIKNLVKLAYNPRKAERDVLYINGVNPVVTFPGQGTILYGDKTLQAKPSAFDRINVRRLFIVLEKAISVAAKYSLFEFNDAFTRSQFKNLINPYLRTIKGRRGITDFLVVCDETNNTPQVIDSNQFVGDIYIKPARSINFIQLNFVAVGTGVQFSEVIGKF
jgi:phage tail sheath protein FI